MEQSKFTTKLNANVIATSNLDHIQATRIDTLTFEGVTSTLISVLDIIQITPKMKAELAGYLKGEDGTDYLITVTTNRLEGTQEIPLEEHILGVFNFVKFADIIGFTESFMREADGSDLTPMNTTLQ